MKKFIKVGVVIMSILFIGYSGFVVVEGGKSYKDALRKANAELVDAESRLEALKSKKPETTESVTSKLNNIAEIGKTVASLQNKYREVTTSSDRLDIVKDLDKYFTESAPNGKGSWFATDGSTSGVRSKWVFTTTYSFNTDSVDCVFASVDEKDQNRVLAYVFATYDTGLKKFIKTEQRITKLGSEAVGTSNGQDTKGGR